MIELKNVNVAYGNIKALHDINLIARPGEITAVLGANGAGKSSLLKAIAGAVPSASGAVMINNEDLTRLPAHLRARKGVSLAMEGRRLFRGLSVEENLSIAWSFGPRRTPFAQALEQVYQSFPILKERRHGKSGMLSGGQQQMLIVSSVTIREPQYMLLDEPSLGLAPIIVQQIFGFITHYSNSRQTTVVLAEQMAAMALQIADQGYVLRHGRVVMQGTADELKKADVVSQLSAAYL
ncbi:MAG: ABC transporter ATP-binding protein [Burkholderiales bacterium]|jgi:branched-chain amino acid transport system ATP-binding protein|nr:ABC transporter ATP-binding protein [Burkholderiales bacterium]